MKKTGNVLIEARSLTVDFPTYAADRSLKRSILKASTGGRLASDSQSRIAVRAIDSLDLSVCDGDRVGLYGHNGSGKTTLLRVLTGAYAPTAGFLRVSGTVASLLDISMGMEGDATGWENIMLRGLMMGMQPAEVREKMQEIGMFSGLGHYLDMPLRTYSSGMKVRLAFAVSTAVVTDILLLDEWLSVGDECFQQQASNRLQELVEKSSVMVLASHSKELIKAVCNRVILMEQGRMVGEIKPEEMNVI